MRQGTNISCMVAVNHVGLFSYEIEDGAFDGKSFRFYQQKLSVHFVASTNDVLVKDNLASIIEKNINFRFMPAYSH